MLTGSAFHAVGPATVKERSPNLERVRGMSSRQRDDDLRPARRAVLDTGTQQFVIYSGARLANHFWLFSFILIFICNPTALTNTVTFN